MCLRRRTRFRTNVEQPQRRQAQRRAADALVSTRRRRDDLSDDLFTVMNVVQENALRGNIMYTHDGTVTKVRSVSSITKELEVNRAAWASAMKLLDAA